MTSTCAASSSISTTVGTFHAVPSKPITCSAFDRFCRGRNPEGKQDPIREPLDQSQLLRKGDDGERRPPDRYLRQASHSARRRIILRLQVSSRLQPYN